MRGRLLTIVPILVLTFGLATIGFSQMQGIPGPKVGADAPLFKGKTLEGKEINLKDQYKDSLILVDFWATWCPPCRAEIPNLQKIYKKYQGKGFEIISINVTDSKETLQEFMEEEENKMPWIHILDAETKNEIAQKYEVTGIPAPYLINHEGKIVARDIGLRGPNLVKTIEEHIKNLPEKEEDQQNSAPEEKESEEG
ncbi:MAG: TlpA family protein disulfide reductase [bacterium]|jgi:thiol-disulfide isomerase/thioredoxin